MISSRRTCGVCRKPRASDRGGGEDGCLVGREALFALRAFGRMHGNILLWVGWSVSVVGESSNFMLVNETLCPPHALPANSTIWDLVVTTNATSHDLSPRSLIAALSCTSPHHTHSPHTHTTHTSKGIVARSLRAFGTDMHL